MQFGPACGQFSKLFVSSPGLCGSVEDPNFVAVVAHWWLIFVCLYNHLLLLLLLLLLCVCVCV